ncbi:MAG: molybdopterin-guanine dinucleotide biosynthesis protein [Caloramator sp.]|jgi:GTP:adenosylcobinamide-phosphate guanylyltransferase|uniref:nucleotidyltransferase family protein n=1 Tax=Caloramator sp. TaxID=1871330 RepID=UPI001E00E916|nr:nucleotidyltransferase family protein [Caloramator sp.]MBZ4663970.1 molybdopterin-guanine dinucleotide biosynthesis protein [Caloramator sp.]
MVNALILAGDKGRDGVSKALLKIGDKYMVDYIIDALKECKKVKDIYIVCDEGVKNVLKDRVKGCINPAGDIIDNIVLASECIEDKKTPLIICTADIPLIKSSAIEEFVEECEKRNIDVGYPIIDKKLNDEKYPDVRRTYVKMREGVYTGGNIVYIKMEAIKNCTEKAKKLVEYRKKPLKMGRTLGFTFLIRLALGKLTIEAVEKKIGKMFNVDGRAIFTKYPEIGNDVDKQEDIDFVKKYLNIV